MTITADDLQAMETDIETLQRELHRLEALEDKLVRDAGIDLAQVPELADMPPELAAALEKAQAAADAAGEDMIARHRHGRSGAEVDQERNMALGKRRMKTV